MISILFLLSACTNSDKTEPVTASHHAMGTLTDFTVYGKNAEGAIAKGKEILSDLESKMSLNIKNSEVNQINQQAGKKPVQVSEDTFRVIERSLYYSELTKGRFDITIAPITSLWNIGQEDQRIPKDSEIQEALPLVDYKNIKINKEERSVFLEKEGMKIDLGAIAKGYAADKILDAFQEIGIENALVSVGGNIKVMGKNPQKDRLWKVGVRHPRKARGSFFATTDLESGETMVTSGDYERFFIANDVRYHHIFDAKTGRPSDSDIIGASIITKNSMDADSLSTSVFLLGSQEGIKLIEKIEGAEAIVITKDYEIIMTKGAINKVELLENNDRK